MKEINFDKYWSATFDALEEFVFILDKQYSVRKVNDAFLRFSGKEAKEVLGKKCYEIIHSGQESIDDCPYCEMQKTKKYEKREIWEPTFKKWFFVQTAPVNDEAGELIGSIHLMSDITNYKFVEEEAVKVKEDLERIFQVVPSAVFTVDQKRVVTGWNKKAEDITGYTAEEIIGKPCTTFADEPCKENCGLYRDDVLKPIAGAECSIKKKNGDVLTVLKNADILRDNDGNILGGIESFNDITGRKNTEKELIEARDRLEQQSWGLQRTNESIKNLYKNLERKNFELKKLDQLKSDFVSTVSHELRTPLAISTEGINLILDGIVGDINEEQKDLLKTSKENLYRLHAIVNDLLDISKIESGEITLRKTIVDVKAILKKLTEDYKNVLDTKKQEINVLFPEGEMFLFVDGEKVIQVVTNLLNNAHKFTPEGGKIDLELSMEEEGFLCRVTDTGVGIEEENIPKLFDKFTQFGRTHGPGIKGTGLGLTISKSLIELHGGKIWAESKINEGTTFKFSLPNQEKLKQKFDKDVEKILNESRINNVSSVFIAISFPDVEASKKKFTKSEINAAFNIVFEVLAKVVTRSTDRYMLYENDTIQLLLGGTDRKGGSKLLERIKLSVNEKMSKIIEDATFRVKYGFAMHPEDGFAKKDLEVIAKKEIGREKRVLIVDDHPQIGRLIQMRLEAHNINTTQVFNGEEALDYLNENNVDLILLDIIMPKMNGYEVLGRLKQNTLLADIPVVILTDKQLSEVKEECRELGGIPIVEKSGNLSNILNLIQELT